MTEKFNSDGTSTENLGIAIKNHVEITKKIIDRLSPSLVLTMLNAKILRIMLKHDLNDESKAELLELLNSGIDDLEQATYKKGVE